MTLAGKILRYFAFFWVFLLSLSVLPYLTFNTQFGFLQLKQFAVKTGWYLPGFYAHIFASSVILVVGFLQFSKKVYNNRPLHRKLGKVYVFGVLFFSAPGAYVMTMFVNRGMGPFTSFLLQNTLWIIFTIAAWYYAKNVNIPQHVKMMRRSYALAFAAVTLRFYIYLLHLIGPGVNFAHNYLIIAFLSWVPNLLLVEWLNGNDKGAVQIK